MAPKHEEVVPLRELVKQHMDESNKNNSLILQKLAAIETHGLYAKESIVTHSKEINDLKSSNDRQKGAMWAIGAGGVTGIIALLKSFFGQ